MIHVTQGHEKGIGLEVFLKACLRSSRPCLDRIKLHTNKSSLATSLSSIGIPYQIEHADHDDKNKKYLFFGSKRILLQIITHDQNQSLNSLESALERIADNDILLTLPTSKDQLPFEGENCSGYTEYLRKRFKLKEIAMTFKGPRGLFLLISDHIPLNKVNQYITSSLIEKKISVVLENYPKYFEPIESVLIAGLNPHAGEGGVLGPEEASLEPIIIQLQSKFPHVEINGFYPGDTLHFHRRSNQLCSYMFHDQGLPLFKSENGILGLNISLGLSFLRLSVDHGTAFNLYGKNNADSTGCYYVLQEAYRVDRNVNK